MEALGIRGLSKSFGGLQALRDVNLSIKRGERHVIIGPNGAGKTTLFHIITGLLQPSRGSIFLYGRNITGFSPHQRAALGITRTFQITSLFPNLSVMENVTLAVQARERAKFALYRPLTSYKQILGRVEQLLKDWDLWDERDKTVRNLSYGRQRQLELVLALAGEPKVLLLDEPTAGLSPAETLAVTNMIGGLDKHITIVLIEHDMDVAFKLAERITVLHRGQVLAEGDPREVKENPQVQRIYLGLEE